MAEDFVNGWNEILYVSAKDGMRYGYQIYEWIRKIMLDYNFLIDSKVSVWEGFPGGCGRSGPNTPVKNMTERLDLAKGLEARGASFNLKSAGRPSISLELTQPDLDLTDYENLHLSYKSGLHRALKSESVVIGWIDSVFRDGKNKFLVVDRKKSNFEYWTNKNIGKRLVDTVALGRQFLADPLLPKKVTGGNSGENQWCCMCDNYIKFLIRQEALGCVIYQKEYIKRLREIWREKGSPDRKAHLDTEGSQP